MACVEQNRSNRSGCLRKWEAPKEAGFQSSTPSRAGSDIRQGRAIVKDNATA